MRRARRAAPPNEYTLIFHAELCPKETVGSCGGKIDGLPNSAAEGGWEGGQRSSAVGIGQGAVRRTRGCGGHAAALSGEAIGRYAAAGG